MLTGGASGIGAAIAERLKADGLVVASLDVAAPDAPRPGIIDIGCDITDRSAVASAVDHVHDVAGPVSIVVHCAAYQVVLPFGELDPEAWSRTFRVNVDGAFHIVRAALPDLQASGWGRIVMITSSSQFAPPPGMTHYIASKGALTGMVRALATELGRDGITVNAVAPGLTATSHALHDVPAEHFAVVRSRQAIPRTGEPGDIAAVVSFAVSDDAAFMTGQTLLVDGGESRI
ncbi:3-oxoacyl-ACP reductase [Tersicoccus solisilvae]|uniref:3-oxoacyl-ACP reductase n=1 Tax=Tersicoccus solisilvae TaxID=1882339 RepID=A0ABQ1NTR5_9MICC|nr:3-oxoacyl-ACP reductase [Tersicoccus solisilvae]